MTGNTEAITDDVVTTIADGVAEICLNRAPVNAFSTALYRSVIRTFRELARRTDVHCVLVRSGLPKGFSAGADLREVVESPDGVELPGEYRARIARTCYATILDHPVPTIALVNGFALGAGAVVPACCDIRIGSDDAQIGLTEINAGRCGGGSHLLRLMPQGDVRLMYFTGETLNASDALRLHLFQRVAPVETALEQARALAAQIAAKSPLGLRMAKKALDGCETMPVREGYPYEQRFTLKLGEHPDSAEAARAIMEKRAPVWQWPHGAAGIEDADPPTLPT